MNAVGLTSKSLAGIMEGLPISRPEKLLQYASGKKGTPNQKYMGAAAGLHIPSLQQIAAEQIDHMLSREEEEGPCCWEFFCPDPHGSMYALAHVGVIASYRTFPDLAYRAATVLGWELRIGDLIATPDGDLRGIGGMRAANGTDISRRALTSIYREVRSRQGENLVHRGTGGKTSQLKWDNDSDVLLDAPPWWLKKILDEDVDFANKLLIGPFSQPSPVKLKFKLTVYRWSGGTISSFESPPTEDERKKLIVRGSAAAKRQKRGEPFVDWVRVDWRNPTKHLVRIGENWESEVPKAPEDARVWTVG